MTDDDVNELVNLGNCVLISAVVMRLHASNALQVAACRCRTHSFTHLPLSLIERLRVASRSFVRSFHVPRV